MTYIGSPQHSSSLCNTHTYTLSHLFTRHTHSVWMDGRCSSPRPLISLPRHFPPIVPSSTASPHNEPHRPGDPSTCSLSLYPPSLFSLPSPAAPLYSPSTLRSSLLFLLPLPLFSLHPPTRSLPYSPSTPCHSLFFLYSMPLFTNAGFMFLGTSTLTYASRPSLLFHNRKISNSSPC